mgnify:CR=1 FL=1
MTDAKGRDLTLGGGAGTGGYEAVRRAVDGCGTDGRGAGGVAGDDPDVVAILLSSLEVSNCREFGSCWIGMKLWQMLDLDLFSILMVMMLVGGGLRVALATTHLPLSAVPAALTRDRLRQVLTILASELQERFGVAGEFFQRGARAVRMDEL